MEKFIHLLQQLGIDVNLSDPTAPLLLFACSVLVLNLLALLCFINIIIYLAILYITEHKLFLEKISQYPTLLKIVNIYRKTRISYIVFEVVFFLVCLGAVIRLCLRLIYGLK